MASAANAIDEEWVEKKLRGANSSQDSVQSLSLWALNHKTQHEKIVHIWFKVLKAGNHLHWRKPILTCVVMSIWFYR